MHPSSIRNSPESFCGHSPWNGHLGRACDPSEVRLRTARCDVPGHSEWDKELLKRPSDLGEAEVSEGLPEVELPSCSPGLPEDLVPGALGSHSPFPQAERRVWAAPGAQLHLLHR